MSDLSRRDALQRLALAFAAAGIVDPSDAVAGHHAVQETGRVAGGYAPKALSVREYAALDRLTDLILPADGDRPGARQAAVAAWIDTMLAVSDPLKARCTAGLAWLDDAIAKNGARDFASATPAQQTALLDVIAFQENRTPDNGIGVDFFVLLRRMTCDGFYTSAIGMRDVYLGSAPQASFVVPQAAIDHVLSRSPLK